MKLMTPFRARPGKRRLIVTAAAIASVVAITATACSSGGTSANGAGSGSGSAQDGTLVRFAYNPNAGYLPLMVAVDKGYFAKQGLDVKLVNVPSPATIPATLGKQFELAGSNPGNYFSAVLQNFDVVGVGGTIVDTPQKPLFNLVAQPGITSPEQLKGKRIAFPALAGAIYASTVVWLQRHGVPEGSYKAVTVPFQEMTANLQKKTVDAAVESKPFDAPLLSKGFKSFGDPQTLALNASVISGFTITSRQWAQQHAGIIKKFGTAVQQGIDFIQSNDAAAKNILQKYTQLPDAQIQQTVLPEYSATVSIAQIAAWLPVLKEGGQLNGGTVPDQSTFAIPVSQQK